MDTGQSLCKHAWPEWLNMHTCCFNAGLDLVLRDGHLIVMQEEGRVAAATAETEAMVRTNAWWALLGAVLVAGRGEGLAPVLPELPRKVGAP